MNKERLWTKDFITVGVINFLFCLIFYLLMVVTAPYAVDKFHASTSIAGLVSSIFIIGILVGRLGTGHVIEDIGRKRVLILGTISLIITSALYFAAVSLPLLIIIRLLHGLTFGIASTATGTIVAHVIPPDRRGEGIGYYSMSTILAAAIGPFAGMLLMQHTDFRMIFIITSLIPVIGLGTSFVVGEPDHPLRRDHGKGVTRFHISTFLEFEALPISIIILVIGAGYSVLLVFLSLYARHIHLEEAASLFFLVYAATVLISRPFSGRLLDTKGANFVVYPCLSLFAIGMLFFSRAGHGLFLLLAAVIIGLGYGNFLSCAQAISIKTVPPHRLGLATSTYFICLDLGFGVGPYLLGALVPFTGYRGLYMLVALMILATMVLYHFLHGKKAVA
ncbi:MAG TPA: MFS transporter [Syntrophorhabdaceae bacterium]